MKATSEELAIFVAVVESGSFSRAAEQLGQANSAVSRAVKKLEWFGIPKAVAKVFQCVAMPVCCFSKRL